MEDRENQQPEETQETPQKPTTISRRKLMFGGLAAAVALALKGSTNSRGNDTSTPDIQQNTAPATPDQFLQEAQEENADVKEAFKNGHLEVRDNIDKYFIKVSPDLMNRLQTDGGQIGYTFPFDPSESNNLILESGTQTVNGENQNVIHIKNLADSVIYSPFEGNSKFSKIEGEGGNISITIEGFGQQPPKVGRGTPPIPSSQKFVISGSADNLITALPDGPIKDFKRIATTHNVSGDTKLSVHMESNIDVNKDQFKFLTYKGKIAVLNTPPPPSPSTIPAHR